MLKINITREELKAVFRAVEAGRHSADDAYEDLMLFTQTVRK